MKNIYKIFILVLLPFVGFGQTLTLGKGAKVSIGNNNENSGASFTTGNIDLTGGGGIDFRIYDLSKVTAGIITNTTNGRLEIFTDPDGAGSLICSGTPNAKVRVLTKKNRWSQITPPVEGIVSGDFDQVLKDSWLVWFDESAGANNGTVGDGWTYITSLTDPVNPGEGRSFYRAANKTHIFGGVIRTTDLTISLDYTDSDHGYNLIGNPFTSALLWDGAANWPTTNVSDAIWIWDGTQYGANPGSLTTHNIALGQAFFVRATASGASITLPKSKRNHNTSTFQKKNKNSGRNYVIINADNNGNKDVAYIYFDATGTEGYDDGYDATKMIGSDDAPQLYTLQSEMNLTYNFLSTLDSGSDKIIPLSYIPGASGNQKLTFDLSNLSGATIFIEDLITGDIQNLASNNVYSFTGSKDDTKDRFSLRFSAKGSLSDIDEVVSEINIYSTGNIINIKSTNKAIEQSGTVYIYDISGREILRKEIGDTEIMQIPISSTKGSIIVKVEKGEFSKVEKLIIN